MNGRCECCNKEFSGQGAAMLIGPTADRTWKGLIKVTYLCKTCYDSTMAMLEIIKKER